MDWRNRARARTSRGARDASFSSFVRLSTFVRLSLMLLLTGAGLLGWAAGLGCGNKKKLVMTLDPHPRLPPGVRGLGRRVPFRPMRPVVRVPQPVEAGARFRGSGGPHEGPGGSVDKTLITPKP